MNEPHSHMNQAIAEAQKASGRGEVPVGCVLVAAATGSVITTTGNRTEELGDPTAHAEMLAIREVAAQHKTPRLKGVDMYVTLEPCAMCAATISFARIRRLYFGAYDPKSGGVEHGGQFFSQPTCHHAPEVYGGIEETKCSHLLKVFFAERRLTTGVSTKVP
ncbi:MAG: nucleoside deaminase [Alphaproteobacteria bacterium]|nr:nucleoside deaminase [Alphaproteobacteria bacterium]